MKKFFCYILFVSLVAAVSCDKIDNGQSSRSEVSKNTIGISKLSIGSLGTKSQNRVYENTVASADFSLSVTTEIDDLIDTPMTKSAAVTTSSLDGFQVDGYLDKEIKEKDGASSADKANLRFIGAEHVSRNTTESSATIWSGTFDNPQQWRAGVHHSFWAYTPSVDLNVDADDYTKSQFDFTSDFENDLILACTSNVYYGKDEEPASTRRQNLDFHFYHALSGISAIDNVSFKSYRSDNKADGLVDDPTRGELVRVAARLVNKGSCEVEEEDDRKLSFNWTPDADSYGIDQTFSNNNEYPRYVIPQSLENVVISFVVKDVKRDLTRDDFTFTAAELFGSAAAYVNPGAPASERVWKSWEEGTWYRYSIKGSFNFPYVAGGEDTPGIDLSFSGKAFLSNYLVQSVNTKYIKRLKMTFVGIPKCNSANGTYAFVSISPDPDVDNLAPVVIDSRTGEYQTNADGNFTGAGSKWLKNNNIDLLPGTVDRPEIGFIYNYFTLSNPTRSDGTPVGTVTYRDSSGNILSSASDANVDFTNSICECYFDIDPSWDTITIWAGYIGSNSGKEKTSWKLRNSHIEIVEWR